MRQPVVFSRRYALERQFHVAESRSVEDQFETDPSFVQPFRMFVAAEDDVGDVAIDPMKDTRGAECATLIHREQLGGFATGHLVRLVAAGRAFDDDERIFSEAVARLPDPYRIPAYAFTHTLAYRRMLHQGFVPVGMCGPFHVERGLELS